MKIVLIAHNEKEKELPQVLDGIINNADKNFDLVLLCESKEDKIIKIFEHFKKNNENLFNSIKVLTPIINDFDEKKKMTSFQIQGSVNWKAENLYKIATLRNIALDLNDDILFVDGDIQIPKNTISRINSIKGDIVGGWYFTRFTNDVSCKINEQNIINKEIIELSYTATGCCLIRKNVKTRFRPYGVELEDFTFCRDVIKDGYKIICDTSIYCKHLGKFTDKALHFMELKEKEWQI